jgi:hypothetical protein
MRKLALILAAAATVAAGGALQARERLSPDQELAKITAGRAAGEPVSCIYMPSVRSTKIIENTAIVYDAGSVVYVNHPESGARSLDRDQVLVTKRHSSQLCSIDIVELRDSPGFFYEGFVGLGKFVPYRKVAVR